MPKGGLADLPVQKHVFGSLIKAGKEIFTNPKIKNKLPKDHAGPVKVVGREIDPVMTGGTGLIASLAALISATKDRTKEEEEVIEQAAPVKEPEKETFLDKLRDMDPALARALIAGGAKMLQPTEGPVRSFLGLGEFGEGFSESLAASEAGKPVEQKAYEAYVSSIPEGETVPTFADYMNYFTLKQEDRMATESKLTEILRDRHGKDTKLSDIVLVSTDPNTGKEIVIGANEALLNAGVNYKEIVNKIAREGIPKSKLEE